MQKVFDSDDFPPQDALAAWAEVTSDAVMPTSFQRLDDDIFHGRLSAMSLGPVQASVITYHSFRSSRTPKLIRVSDPECFHVGLMRSGSHVLVQNRQHCAPQPGELTFFDSSRPFDCWADGEDLLLQLPRRLLPLSDCHLDHMLSRTLSGTRGVGRLLATFLTHLAEDGAGYRPQDGPRLGTVAVDLVTTLLAHCLDREDEAPADSRQRAMHLRITSFIQRHLADPRLTVHAIAAAHHISVRSLHRLFQQHDTSVQAWIRGQRLERCRRDLADPLKRDVPIGAIAARWGFSRPADFTRAFRTHHGITPSAYRHTALGDGTGTHR